ncbi:hypothetical protein [Terrisporobacter sp.]|uniref:hypothetical protein n=1 Tax=Terrisporobacter sp. TaxID=1965305 RepID=UPI003995166E
MKGLRNIKENAYIYGMKADYINKNTLRLYSINFLYDSWLVEYTEFGLELKHINKSNKNQKLSYHTQKIYPPYKWKKIFRTITKHNDYVINIKRNFRQNKVEQLLENYTNERNEKNGRINKKIS